VRRLGLDDRSSPRARVVEAALRCMARVGLSKTTVDDVAREAGVSRATLYRQFPGGKDAVLRAVVETEAARLFCDLGVVMGEADDLEALLVAGIVEAARWLTTHDTLGYLVRHEPGAVLPFLAFVEMDRLLGAASNFAAPFLGRWLAPDEAARAAEWAARIVLSYLVCASEETDLTDATAVGHLVATFVAPGIRALRLAGGDGARGDGAGGRRNERPAGAPAA
jgi:AcrR family transcriptional regulator